MRKPTILIALALILAAPALANGSPRAQQTGSTVPVTTVVTVLGRNYSNPPAIAKEDVTVYNRKNRLDVTSWIPAQGDKAGLQLAILIDDADSPVAIGQHFNEIKGFITSQPATTQVGLFYADNGSARSVAPFGTEPQAVVQKLRLPLGRFASASPSIYLSVQDLVSHWPANGTRHEVLVVASGVDYLYPGLQDPYLQTAIDHTRQAGVVVHTIYTGGPRLANTLFRMQIAWQNLVELANDSGGQAFFQGFETPVDFEPIFRQLNTVLNNQYLLTIDAPRSNKKKGELLEIRIHSEQRNVEFSYPSAVFVPGSGS